MSPLRHVVVLGSTGSIGTQALDIVRNNPDRFRVIALSAGGAHVEMLAKQVAEFSPTHVAIASQESADQLRSALAGLGVSTTIHVGPDAASEVAGLACDVVLNGITGAVGLMPTIAALDAGSTLALANKESLVIGGRAVTKRAASGQIVPVDSEHSAIAQALRSGSSDEVARLVLTASGGPFRGKSRAELADVTVAQALNHPTWAMGPVVTVNSSTLMNKGLELIEAHLLFDIPMDRIDVVVHPQSIVHSMVEFVDGSVIAQASPPDMHLPIALGLAWPDRVPGVARACAWETPTSWTFEPVDNETFPALALAKRAATAGGTAPAVLNAANEVAVARFLQGQLPYLGIVDLVSRIVDQHINAGLVSDERLTVEDVVAADLWGSQAATQLLGD